MSAVPPGTRTSPRGVDFIARWEGWRARPYVCPAGVWTIGYGHAMRGQLDEGAVITHERGLALLAADLRTAEAAVCKLVRVPLDVSDFDALVSFAFNAGTGALASSTLLRRLNAGERDAVPAELLRWDKINVGGKLVSNAGLANRRRSEGDLWSRVEPMLVAEAAPFAGLSEADVARTLALVGASLVNLGRQALDEAYGDWTGEPDCADDTRGVYCAAA